MTSIRNVSVSCEKLYEVYENFLRFRSKFDPIGFFHFLQQIRYDLRPEHCFADINTDNMYNVKSCTYYNTLSLRSYICELFHNAVYCFPLVSEYIIHCYNEMHTQIVLGIGSLTELDDEGEICICRIITPFKVYQLNKREIMEIFNANKVTNPNFECINGIVVCLLMGGEENMKITTSYKINKKIKAHKNGDEIK